MGRTSNTPEKLQEALYELMWKHSYGRVTIDAICERAGVKKGSFYHAYPDKATLALEAFEYFWETHSRRPMDAIFSPSENPLNRISNWLSYKLEKTLECQQEHGKIHGCPLYTVGSEISTLEPAVAEKVTDILQRYRSYLTSALRDALADGLLDLDPSEEADGIASDVLTLIEGAMTQARITNSVNPLQRLPSSVGRLIGATLPPPQNLTL